MWGRIGMIRDRSLLAISSTTKRFCRTPFWGKYCCMAVAPSNFMLGQRDLQMLSLRKLTLNASVANTRFTTNGFRLRGCGFESHPSALRKCVDLKNDCGTNNGVQVVREVNIGSSAVNGSSVTNKGNYPGVSDHSLPEKVMLAVDVDEVLGNFVSSLNQFMEDRYSLKCSVSEYHVYEFFKIWNCSRDEADIRVHEFFKSPYFKNGIRPIPGAQKALQRLSEIYNLSIVTSLGAKVLIDDNPRYAIECAEVGIKVLLFDYLNSYPWCKMECKHPLVTKVRNWEEVEDHLSLAVVP